MLAVTHSSETAIVMNWTKMKISRLQTTSSAHNNPLINLQVGVLVAYINTNIMQQLKTWQPCIDDTFNEKLIKTINTSNTYFYSLQNMAGEFKNVG
jgi:hypothetical protein